VNNCFFFNESIIGSTQLSWLGNKEEQPISGKSHTSNSRNTLSWDLWGTWPNVL